MAVIVREVWSHNLEAEIRLIGDLLPLFPVASFDTEFPGTVIDMGLSRFDIASLDAPRSYELMRLNVNATHIIQLGLAISTPDGLLPDLGTDQYRFIWQFNFRDFDAETHAHAPDSVAMLKKQGIDFERNRIDGIESSVFARVILGCGLFSSRWVTWATFHGSYDFGFLIKTLTQKDLPSKFGTFMKLFGVFFGTNVYDVKHMVKSCDGLYGGLEKVAAALGVARVAGNSHQAGSDSLLTLQTFLKLEKEHFREKEGLLEKNRCNLHSLGRMVFDPRFRLNIQRPFCYVLPQPPRRFHVMPQPPQMVMLRNNNFCAYGY